MKKRTLLAVTLLTLTCLGSQTITSQAAAYRGQVISNGKGIIIGYGSGCNIQSILDKLGNCFPNISLPETESPETNVPEAESPEVNVPEVESPEIEIPEDTTTDEHAFIKDVVDLVNAERAKKGLAPLTIDLKVQAAAMVRAKECEQRFSHTRPNGSSFATALKEQGVSYRSSGENIAWGQRSPEEVMKAWMNSSGHRANIMNPNFTTIGVGYYENANGTDYWCQLFTR